MDITLEWLPPTSSMPVKVKKRQDIIYKKHVKTTWLDKSHTFSTIILRRLHKMKKNNKKKMEYIKKKMKHDKNNRKEDFRYHRHTSITDRWSLYWEGWTSSISGSNLAEKYKSTQGENKI